MVKFSLVASPTNRNEIGRKSLEEIVEMVRNPDEIRKGSCLSLRNLKKDHPLYKTIKQSLPCATFPFLHKGKYINGDSVSKPSGYLYLDVDGNLDIDLTSPYIAAYWRSAGFSGYSIIVRVEGVTKKNLRKATEYVSKVVGVPHDKGAISLDRLTYIPFDEEAFYNPSPETLRVEIKDSNSCRKARIDTKVSHPLTLTSLSSVGEVSDTFQISTKNEVLGSLDFGESEYMYLKDKAGYADISHMYVRHIPIGKRNEVIFSLISNTKAINPGMSSGRLFGIAKVLNKKCEKLLSDKELGSIVSSVMKMAKEGKLEIYNNKSMRVVFSTKSNFSGRERKSIAAKLINQKRGEETYQRVKDYMESTGETSPTKIARALGIGRATVYRHINKVNFGKVE